MITLAEAKVGMVDPIEQSVVDEFRRSSRLLDLLPFDDAVSPATGGSTLTYGYTILLTPSTASGRAINKEYTNNEAKRDLKTVNLKIFGGSFKIDRVIAGTSGSINEVNFQLNQKIIGAKNLFHYLVINGDSTVQDSAGDKLEFDGLKNLLGDSASTVVTSAVDISTSAYVDSNYQAFLDEVDAWLATLDQKPDALLMNGKMLTKLKGIARRAGYYSRTEDAFGRGVDNYDNIELINLEKYYNGSATVDCVPIDPDGKTDIYAVVFGQDAFHGVSVNGGKIIETHLPDFTTAGAVKEGDVEFVAAVALKNTLKAGRLKGVKVQAADSPTV